MQLINCKYSPDSRRAGNFSCRCHVSPNIRTYVKVEHDVCVYSLMLLPVEKKAGGENELQEGKYLNNSITRIIIEFQHFSGATSHAY